MTHSSAGMPYIKSEPDDFGNNPNHFRSSSNFGNSQGFGNQFNNQHASSTGVDPNDLTNFGSVPYGYGGNNMSSSFGVGNSGYGEDELLDSLGFSNNDGDGMFNDFTTLNQPSNNKGPGAVQM